MSNIQNTHLPFDGYSRWKQLQPYLSISREKFRQLVVSQKAPQPIRLGSRCTFYKNAEILKFLEDPLNYEAEVSK